MPVASYEIALMTILPAAGLNLLSLSCVAEYIRDYKLAPVYAFWCAQIVVCAAIIFAGQTIVRSAF